MQKRDTLPCWRECSGFWLMIAASATAAGADLHRNYVLDMETSKDRVADHLLSGVGGPGAVVATSGVAKDMAHVLLIEPNQYLREGLRAFLHKDACRSVAAVDSAMSCAGSVTPDLLLLGPGTIARVEAELGLLRDMLSIARNVPTVLLLDLTDDTAVHRVSALGLDAILSVGIAADVLLRSLELVMLGQQIYSPGVELRLASTRSASTEVSDAASMPPPREQRMPGVSDPLSEDVVLSEREVQTLRGLVDGASNKLIAKQLLLSEATIKAHVKSLLRKIRVANRTQAALWALSNQAAWTAVPAGPECSARSQDVRVPFPVGGAFKTDGSAPSI